MNKSRVILIIVFTILAALFFYFFAGNEDPPLQYLWYENYKADSDQPYGTLFIKSMLAHEASEKFIYNDSKPLKILLEKPEAFHGYTYVLVGPSLYLDDMDIDALLSFIYAGNDAFISTLEAPTQLAGMIHYDCDEAVTYHASFYEKANLNFFNDELKKDGGYDYRFRFGRDDEFHSWYSVYPNYFCDSSKLVVPLGFHGDEEVNFIKVPHGSGNLYLHTTPLTFTNYFLTKADKVEYASSVFSHLAHKENLIWDEYSKVPFVGDRSSANSPLYFIMQQPSLKYAWWLLLLGIVLYIFFAAKRAQRTIPVLEVKSNTSLEFVRMISSLYYVNGNHLDMAKKKMKYFSYFVRSRYGIHETSLSSETITKLAEKSKVDRELIADIVNQYNGLESMRFNILPQTLSAFYDAVEKFYKHCK